jgi:glutamate-1-semialdehyde aminotransferase
LPYGDTAALRGLLDEHGDEVAAVFVETAVFDFDPEFLRDCRQECSRHGCLLIFDEIITGFRLALGGAQEVAGVTPDMATLGKAMANGYPIAAVVGRSEILREAARLWISVTFGSEGASLAAALATLKKLEGERVIGHLTRLGAMLKQGWESIERELPRAGLRISGTGSLPALRIQDEKVETGLMREMISRGFLIRRGHYWFTAMMHTEADVARTLDAMRESLLAVPLALRGERA